MNRHLNQPAAAPDNTPGDPTVMALGDRISRYENDRITPSLEALIRLAEALDVSCDYLLIDGPPSPPATPLSPSASANSPPSTPPSCTSSTASSPKTACATPSTKPADMAGIEDTTVVDLIGHDPTADEYVLYTVETRPWGDNPLQGPCR